MFDIFGVTFFEMGVLTILIVYIKLQCATVQCGKANIFPNTIF